MQNNKIDIKFGELLELSFADLKLLPHEKYEITSILINSLLQKYRYAIIDFDTGKILLQRNENNFQIIDKIPFTYIKNFESYLIDVVFKQTLIDKNIEYIVFINRDILYSRFNLKHENFESFKQALSNTSFRYIDLSFSKCYRHQTNLNYPKTIYVNISILNKFKRYNERNLDAGYFLLESNLLYCVGDYYIDNAHELSFCFVSTINSRYTQRTIQYKKGNSIFLNENKIREIYHRSRKNSYLIGLEEDNAEYFALNQIALSSFSQ